MQERFEETGSIAEGKLIADAAAMELSENREVDVKQGKEEEEMQSCWKKRMHDHHGHHLRPHHHGRLLHPHHHGPHLHPHHHGRLLHPHHHGPHLHPHHHGRLLHPHHHGPHLHPHHHGHHKEKKWEKLEKKRMEMCGEKMKGREGWNSKFVGKLKHKLEKIDLKIESLQEKKLFILRRIQEIDEEEEKKKKKYETPLPTTNSA